MNDKSSPEELFQDARHMAEVYFGRFEREAERLLADLQSNGDIQITGPEESVLKLRSTVHDRRASRRFAGERATRPCLLPSSADVRPGGGTRR
jgi:hypothetical protein